MDGAQGFDFRAAKLGQILVYVGVITEAQLAEARKSCDPDEKNLGQVLVALGFTSEEKIIKAVSIRLGIPYFTSFEGMIEPEAGKALPEAAARKHLAAPIFRSEDSLTVAMVDPTDIHAIDDLSRQSGLRVLPVMTTLSALFDAIQQVYGEKVGAAEPAAPALRAAQDKIIRFQAEERSVVDTINGLLEEGMARKASDIHIESADKLVRVRFRVDGMLQDGKTFAKELESALIARVKILAKLDITETRLPQDGHLRFEYGGRSVDLRVSVAPTVSGEKAVLRILDSSRSLKKLSELGLSQGALDSFRQVIRRPNGIVLVTGPTGSGKTTTLYSAVGELNSQDRNIVTLEDPVEYRIDRVNQIETNARIGLTFAAGLRSILRQDPNVILVGEIRDFETAEIAVQAAITGHLVFSTLHTNDAVSTVHRLLNMRIEPFLLAAALGGVMAQRLVRRLCPRCKKPHELTADEVKALNSSLESLRTSAPFFEAVGCEACFQSGYAGRLAIHEWLPVTRRIRELILKRPSVDELKEAAVAQGMATLQADALEKASRGETSLAEVLRATHEEDHAAL